MIEPAFAHSGHSVSAASDRVVGRLGAPLSITVDHGSEFMSKALEEWAWRRDVKLDFILPGKHNENAHIESINGRLRDEFLNVNQFVSIDDARATIEAWRRDYNEARPHSSLRNPHRWRRRHAGGEVIVVRYADDSVVGFQVPADAWRFLGALRTRLAKFGLTLNEEETRIVEFGRFAMQRRANRGQRRPGMDLCGGGGQPPSLPRPIELLQGGLNFSERACCRPGLPHPTLPRTEKGSFSVSLWEKDRG